MDYTNVLNELNKASTFDLYRLYAAIGFEMNKPERVTSIKKKLWIGMQLSYFDILENRLIKIVLCKIGHTNATVINEARNQKISLPYYMLNLDHADTNIYESNSQESLTVNHLKVGDFLGFDKDGQSIFGIVKRLNKKTVTLGTQTGYQWRVSYSLLYRVHDASVVVPELEKNSL